MKKRKGKKEYEIEIRLALSCQCRNKCTNKNGRRDQRTQFTIRMPKKEINLWERINERTKRRKKMEERQIPSATSKKKNDCFDNACDIDVRACAFTHNAMRETVKFSLTVGVKKAA